MCIVLSRESSDCAALLLMFICRDTDLNAHLDFSEEFYHKKERDEGSAGIRGRLINIDTDWRRKPTDSGDPAGADEEPESKKRDTQQRQYQFYESIKPAPLLQQ